jgi:HK97 family phage portal protein
MIVEAIRSAFGGVARSPVYGSLENPAVSLNDPSTWAALGAGQPTAAGQAVSHRSSMSCAAVFQCVSIISGDAAGVRRHVYTNTRDGESQIDYRHPVEPIIAVRPNPETPAYRFWRRLMAHALIWGNGYAYIRRRGRSPADRVEEIINLLPDRTTPQCDGRGELYYMTEVVGKDGVPRLEPLLPHEVLHIHGLSFDNHQGLDLILAARNAIGLALAAENFNSKFFKHGMNAGGVLELPTSMTVKAADNLEQGFRKRLGEDQWFRTVILRDGAKFHQTTVNAEQSQMHELRDDQVREVARFFNLPPRKLGLADSLSYNSSEQDQLQYLTGALWHWLCEIEGECGLKLLAEREYLEQTRTIEHDTDDIAQPDTKTLEEILAIRRTNNIISPNEWRLKIGMPKRTDEGGDSFDNPNTTAGGAPSEPAENPAEEVAPTEQAKPQDAASQRRLFAWAAGRLVRRIAADARRLSGKPNKFCAWADDRMGFTTLTRDHLEPAVASIAGTLGLDPQETWQMMESSIVTEIVEQVNEISLAVSADKLPDAVELWATNLDDAVATWQITLFGE